MNNKNELKNRLKNAGISQEKIAEVLGIHRVTLNEKINGKAAFSIDEICKIAKALQMSRKQVADIFLNEVLEDGVLDNVGKIVIETDEKNPTTIVEISNLSGEETPIKIFGNYRVRFLDWLD